MKINTKLKAQRVQKDSYRFLSYIMDILKCSMFKMSLIFMSFRDIVQNKFDLKKTKIEIKDMQLICIFDLLI